MTKQSRFFRHFSFLLLYGLIILYTLIFPTTASWFIFYAFTLWIALSFMSTRQSVHLTRTQKQKKDDNTFTFIFTFENKRRHPFLLSTIDIILVLNDIRQSSSSAVFFASHVESQFPSITLPRGHHDTLTIDVIGTGLFGVWKKHSQLIVPINIDVFPDSLLKSQRYQMMHHLSPYLTDTIDSFQHDYYMNDIRSFQNRDALSGIDWKTSLKRGQWMVKEYETKEEAPVELYFLGFDTESFESLLSICYSLYTELNKIQDVKIFLLGQFENTVTTVQDESGFLTIKPVQNKQELIDLWQTISPSFSKKVIFKSTDTPVPLGSQSSEADVYVDEDISLVTKGGEPDSDQHYG